jgi:hypothetical protein
LFAYPKITHPFFPFSPFPFFASYTDRSTAPEVDFRTSQGADARSLGLGKKVERALMGAIG